MQNRGARKRLFIESTTLEEQRSKEQRTDDQQRSEEQRSDESEKIVMNAIIDRSVWEISAKFLNFIRKIYETHHEQWNEQEMKEYFALMKKASPLFVKSSKYDDDDYVPPNILDGIIQEDPRILDQLLVMKRFI
jgi:hypothetical protein